MSDDDEEFAAKRFRVNMRLIDAQGNKSISSRETFESDIEGDALIGEISGEACAHAFLGFKELTSMQDRAHFTVGLLRVFAEDLSGEGDISESLESALYEAQGIIELWLEKDVQRINEWISKLHADSKENPTQ